MRGLTLAAFVICELVCLAVILAAGAVASASSSPPVKEIKWYLIGEAVADAIPVKETSCKPYSRTKVYCLSVVDFGMSYDLCSHGIFWLKGQVVQGQFSDPKPCPKS